MVSKNKKVLFEESENEEEEEDGELHINKAYANKYQEWRLSEELQKYKDRFGDDDLTSSESSSDEDFAEADNPEFDREFLRTLGALHKKIDPKLHGARFFTGDYSKKKEKEKEEKIMTVKDYERLIIRDRGGELDEEEGQGSVKGKMKAPKGEVGGFEDGLSSDEDDDGDALLKSGLFKVKETPNSSKEVEAENQENPLAFIRGESSTVKNEEDRVLLEGLKKVWNDPKKSKDEKWLIDFFVNERYNEEEDESKLRPYNGVIIDEEPISDDEKTLESMETFETKYRFRFEEPDEEFIKKYPRIIPDSLRTKDESRKQKRIAVKERKQKEKEIKRQEIERLKALKYKEIQAKIEKIKEASGNQDIDLGEKLFEEDFDEANHDQVMSGMFGDDYYTTNDCDEEKPVFDDDDDIDVIQDYDQWLEKQGGSQFGGAGAGDWEEEEHWDESMGDGNDDRAGSKKALEQEMIQASSKKKGRRRKSKFAMAIKQKKPVFDPDEKTFESYFDEYYQLDFEDIISGVPCRFKYRKVEPNNFGLTTEEILSAQDRELNKWTSLKKMLKYNRDKTEELKDSKMYHHRASLPHVKQKILPSLFVEDTVNHHITEEEKKRLKNLKKKLRRQQKLQSTMEGSSSTQTLGEFEHASDSQNESNTIQQDGGTGPHKPTKKRKSSTAHSSQDEKVNQTSAAETLEQPKKRKKKKSIENNSYEDNLHAPLSSSIQRKINETEELKSNSIKNVEETTDILPGSKVSEADNKKKRQKKKKANRQSTSEVTQKTKRHSAPALENSVFKGISDSRLAAYGENPKKIKNKVKYGKQNF